MKREIVKRINRGIALLAIFLFGVGASAYGLPEIDNVGQGDIQISQPDENTLNIIASDNSIINYISFDIGSGESVNLTLPSAKSQILNRVTGEGASQLMGLLSCNGLFILTNPAGIRLGEGATIDVNRLILSTRDIANQDFIDKEYLFEKASGQAQDKLLLNQGQINIEEGGFGVLIAGGIENEGKIVASAGQVALASGNVVRLGISSDGLVSVDIEEKTAQTIYDYQGNPITSQIQNTGSIDAPASRVILKADSLPGIFEKAINLEGYIRAEEAQGKEGEISLMASQDIAVGGSLEATNIYIGQAGVLVPEDVSITQSLQAEKEVEVLANGDIQVAADISSQSGDIVLFADYDNDKSGRFSQAAATTIETAAEGSIYIDSSGTMELAGTIATASGSIKIGTKRMPQAIEGKPNYIHRQGNIQITSKQSYENKKILETSRGDSLLYNPQEGISLEAPSG